MNIRYAIAALPALLLSASFGAQAANVAFGKHVQLVGEFGTGSGYLDPCCLPPLPPASIITDGILQSGDAFENGVWWDEQFTGIHNKIVIDLEGLYSITGFGAMVDNNDMYLLEILDRYGVWAPAWSIPEFTSGGGLQWRSIDLPLPVIGSALRLSAFPPSHYGTDYAYSVSEIQAYAVPEPGTVGLLSLGLIGLGALRLRARAQP